MSTNTESTEPAITSQPPLSRKVSIANDPVASDNRYDNMGFESSLRRKTSQQSDHSDHHHHHHHTTPTRKRSNLVNGGAQAPHSDADSLYSHHSHGNDIKHFGESKARQYIHQQQMESPFNKTAQLEQSWIYTFCVRCRGEDNTPSWEPPLWQKCCPFPLCPTFRQFARMWSIILIGLIAWLTLYVIIGKTAAPGGKLFGLVVLTVAAHFGGFLISLTTLPRLIGMLLTGILFQNVGWVDLSGELIEVTSILRKFALTLILIRAGLEMDPIAFKKVYITILKLGLVPWTAECTVTAVLSHFFLDLPWMWAFALGAIIAAVSPAVVVPCLFRLRTKGYGVAKGIPTLVIAVAGIDDAASVAIFGIVASILFGTGDLAYQISQAPVCVVGGLAFGVFWGVLSKFVPEKGDAYVIPIRTLMLFSGGLMAVFGSETLGFEGAGPLGVVFAAFVSNYFWCQQGWEIEDNPVTTAFEIFWMFFEPILFGITGASVKINELDPNIVIVGVGILVTGAVLRICTTIAIAFGDKLNIKEKIFVALSWMAKATVQAALGPVALKKLGDHGTPEEKHYAEIVLMICILSIVITAPIGAILISVTGTKFLTKTKQMPSTEGWRRSHRPSLYDISIIDEQEEREDPELQKDEQTVENTNSNANKPVYTITK